MHVLVMFSSCSAHNSVLPEKGLYRSSIQLSTISISYPSSKNGGQAPTRFPASDMKLIICIAPSIPTPHMLLGVTMSSPSHGAPRSSHCNTPQPSNFSGAILSAKDLHILIFPSE